MPMQPMMGGAPPSGPGMLGAGGPMGMGAPGGGMPPAGAGGSPVVAGPPAGGYAIPPAPAGSTGPRPLPQGVPVEPGKSAIDKITETIGTMPPGQLLDIMSQMKVGGRAPPFSRVTLKTDALMRSAGSRYCESVRGACPLDGSAAAVVCLVPGHALHGHRRPYHPGRASCC